jgi:hypothetical protein
MGRLVGSWVLEAPIGSGSFAVVWRARHVRSGAVAAVKEINTEKVSPPSHPHHHTAALPLWPQGGEGALHRRTDRGNGPEPEGGHAVTARSATWRTGVAPPHRPGAPPAPPLPHDRPAPHPFSTAKPQAAGEPGERDRGAGGDEAPQHRVHAGPRAGGCPRAAFTAHSGTALCDCVAPDPRRGSKAHGTHWSRGGAPPSCPGRVARHAPTLNTRAHPPYRRRARRCTAALWPAPAGDAVRLCIMPLRRPPTPRHALPTPRPTAPHPTPRRRSPGASSWSSSSAGRATWGSTCGATAAWARPPPGSSCSSWPRGSRRCGSKT